MDILAHTLWAGTGVAIWRRHASIAPHTAVFTLALAALPDLLHVLPILGWWIVGDGSFSVLQAYVSAAPGQEPAMPSIVTLLSHHLHCVAHSAVVASVVTLLVWRQRGALWIPLLGWWSHIAIDVFTHSADYYASPVLYPFTARGFDGIAWTASWFMVLNYLSLGAIALWLRITARHRGIRRSESAYADAGDSNESRPPATQP